MSSYDNYQGKHARHAAGADFSRQSREEDMTQAFDYLYDGQPTVRQARMTQPFDYQEPSDPYATQAYGDSCSAHYDSHAGQAYVDPYATQAYQAQSQSQSYGSYGSDAGRTQRIDLPYGQRGAYGSSSACDTPPVEYAQQAYSDVSYVNGSGNAQVVGYAKKPGRQIDLNPKKTKRESKKQARQQKRQQKQQQRQQRSMSPRTGLGLLKKLITLLIILAIPIGIYGFLLDQELAIPREQRDAVEDALQPAGLFKPFYVLVLGSDSREGSEQATQITGERSDVIMLLRVDPWKDQITMVSIPRDTPYHTSDGSVVKINETYSYGGPAETIRAVSEVTGIGVNHYVEVGFSDLENIVNVIGGVTVPVNTPLSYSDALTGENVTIDAGEQTLDGQAAQIFARARHEYGADQDMYRQNNVRILLSAILNKIIHRPIWEIPGTVLKVAHYVTTDMKSRNFAFMALSMLLHPGGTTIYSCTGPYAGDINYDAGGQWLCYENPEGWARLMSIVDEGEDPNQYDLGY